MLKGFSYQMYEVARAALAPARAVSDASRFVFANPLNPLSVTPLARNIAAGAEIFERVTRRFGKPAFSLRETKIASESVPIFESVVWERAFCRLLHFRRAGLELAKPQPKLLIVAPLSGHYATLLRGTVENFLPSHDVHITDWADARMVPLAAGDFTLDHYIDYLRDMLDALGPGVHTIGVCQPAVPLIAAVALMEAEGHPARPASMTLMGGPIDTRRSPTAVNHFAKRRGVEWFRRNCLYGVPFPYPGIGRLVYPGFLQLSGFMKMNLDRHVKAHIEMFNHLVRGDGDSAEKHREFYDEYLAVMDLTAEYYMQTIETVFICHALPNGEMTHRDRKVDLSEIRSCALLTVEGEKDDISGIGQTQAAHDLCVNIPTNLRGHYLQKDVGHYGVFNGERFRRQIAPRIAEFHTMVDEARKRQVGALI
jgi:poly(3-hydroxybutyrate) depolymerase